VDESGTHKLYPSRSFAELTSFSISITKRTRKISLYSRLYKWKKARSYPDRYLFFKNI
jgi:hypothetical protein